LPWRQLGRLVEAPRQVDRVLGVRAADLCDRLAVTVAGQARDPVRAGEGRQVRRIDGVRARAHTRVGDRSRRGPLGFAGLSSAAPDS
jgi:hypothetical protein